MNAPLGFSPPMPAPAPDAIGALGVLSRLRDNAFAAFPSRCLREPVVRLDLPGRPLFLVTGGAAMAEVLQARAGDYERVAAARRVLGPLVGRGLLTSEGDQWRRQRKAMAPVFAPRAMPVMAAHILRAAEAACARLEAAAGRPADLLAAMQALSLEISAVSMFSLESDGFRDQLRAMVAHYTATIGRPSLQDFLLPAWAPTPLTLRRALFRRRWRRLIRSVVAPRLVPGPAAQSRDLFDLLASAHRREDADLLLDEVATMILAGHETTGLALFWALYLLANAPEWRRRIREEAGALDLTPETAAQALPRLVATRAVASEALRLYPPAFMAARVAATATAIGGFAAPRGSMVFTPFWLLHRHPAEWSRPHVFDPERFLREPEPGRARFLPFGAGPHVCIGAQLAMAEIVLVLASLLARFEVALADGGRPVLPVATLATRPDHAPAFRVTPLRPAPGGAPAPAPRRDRTP